MTNPSFATIGDEGGLNDTSRVLSTKIPTFKYILHYESIYGLRSTRPLMSVRAKILCSNPRECLSKPPKPQSTQRAFERIPEFSITHPVDKYSPIAQMSQAYAFTGKVMVGMQRDDKAMMEVRKRQK